MALGKIAVHWSNTLALGLDKSTTKNNKIGDEGLSWNKGLRDPLVHSKDPTKDQGNQGQTSLLQQATLFVRNLPRELQNPSLLGGLMAANLVNPIAGRLIGSLVGRSLGKGVQLALSNLGGLAAEGLAFEAVQHGIHLAQGLPVQPFEKSLRQAYWMMGNLHWTGGLGRTLVQSTRVSRALVRLAPQYRRAFAHAAPHAFTYSGIYLSQTTGHLVGLPTPEASQAWMQSAFILFHFKLASDSLAVLAPGSLSLARQLQRENTAALSQGMEGVRHLWHQAFSRQGLGKLEKNRLALATGSLQATQQLVFHRPTQNPDPKRAASIQWTYAFQKERAGSTESSEVGKLLDRDFPYLEDPNLGNPITHVEIKPPQAARRYLARLLEYNAESNRACLQVVGTPTRDVKKRPLRSGLKTQLDGAKLLTPASSPESITTWAPPIVEPELQWLGKYFFERIPWLNWQVLRFSELHAPSERRQIINPHKFNSTLPVIDPEMLQIQTEVRNILLQPKTFSQWLVDFTYSVVKRMHAAGERVQGPDTLISPRHHGKLKKYMEAELLERADRLGFAGAFTIPGQTTNISRLDFLRQVEAGKVIFDNNFANNYSHGWPPHAVAAVFLGESVPGYLKYYRYQGSYDRDLPSTVRGLWNLGYDSLRDNTYLRNPTHLYHNLLIVMPAVHPLAMPYFTRP